MYRTVILVYCAAAIVSCQKSEEGVIDQFHLPPFVSDLSVEPKAINTDTIIVGQQPQPGDQLAIKVRVLARVSDPEGASDVKDVSALVLKPASQSTIQTKQLLDDGNPPDSKAGDGIFGGNISFVIARSEIGDFRVEVVALDQSNLPSNHVSASVTVLRLNRPPVISELKAADSVSISTATVLVKLTIRASDPDGQSDIQKVFFNSYRPDGSLSSGSPFQMFDDGDLAGISGDETRGDGIYSLTVQLPSTTQKGNYRFEFQATDRSGAGSNILVHTLRVR